MSNAHPIEVLAVPRAELTELVERVRPQVSEADYQLLRRLIDTVAFVLEVLQRKTLSLARLRRLLFGPRTEKTGPVAPLPAPPPKRPRQGHGRRGADAYPGAARVAVAHPTLRAGTVCPACRQGKLYRLAAPARLLRVVGQPPIQAAVYVLEKLRCALCGKVFTAPAPPQAGREKYADTVATTLALLRYGTGVPCERLARLQESLGVPVAATTQWELVQARATELAPVYAQLIHHAAQGQVLHNDDTAMTVLSLKAAVPPADGPNEEPAPRERTGIFTSGIVAQAGAHPIALFFTGRQHAGENLRDVLQHRDPQLPTPIQMCDALARNLPKDTPALLAQCLVHARRLFIEVAPSFPAQCQRVLADIGTLYHHEEQTRTGSAAERLRFHQTHSQPILDALQTWMQGQLDTHQVEPNSGLGQAFNYMLKRWAPLTLFLREPGAPLDNNLCERALKMAILHRKNSLAYKTQKGAGVGDLFMSLIHTCRLNAVNPFAYLTALHRHAAQVLAHPEQWLPWNYPATPVPADSG